MPLEVLGVERVVRRAVELEREPPEREHRPVALALAALGQPRLERRVREGLERWMREDPESRDVAEVLLEIVDERRADAGKPRPDRRKQPEDPA